MVVKNTKNVNDHHIHTNRIIIGIMVNITTITKTKIYKNTNQTTKTPTERNKSLVNFIYGAGCRYKHVDKDNKNINMKNINKNNHYFTSNFTSSIPLSSNKKIKVAETQNVNRNINVNTPTPQTHTQSFVDTQELISDTLNYGLKYIRWITCGMEQCYKRSDIDICLSFIDRLLFYYLYTPIEINEKYLPQIPTFLCEKKQQDKWQDFDYSNSRNIECNDPWYLSCANVVSKQIFTLPDGIPIIITVKARCMSELGQLNIGIVPSECKVIKSDKNQYFHNLVEKNGIGISIVRNGLLEFSKYGALCKQQFMKDDWIGSELSLIIVGNHMKLYHNGKFIEYVDIGSQQNNGYRIVIG
eukprot:216689_1